VRELLEKAGVTLRKATPEDLVASYMAGTSVNALAREHQLPYAQVRATLLAAGVTLRSRSEACRFVDNFPTTKLTAEQRETLIDELRLGVKAHSQLAADYGVSRERIRQIAKAAQAPTGRDIRRRIKDLRERETAEQEAKAEQERREKQEERHLLWRKLWAEGKSMSEMAKILNRSPMAIGVRLVELRRLHPGWFPYRRRRAGADPTATSTPLPDQPAP